ncbi:cytochrome P450 [Aspergillus nidulans var. acristatus]
MAFVASLLLSCRNAVFVLAVTLATVVARILYQNYRRAENLKRTGRIDGLPVLNLDGDDFERATKRYRTELKELLQLGYKQFKHGIYQLWSVYGFVTIVSPDFLQELNALPKGTLDFYGAVQKRMVGDYEWVTLGDHLEAHTILTDLTRQTANLLPDLGKEVVYALQSELDGCDDWTPRTVYPTILRVVALVTGRAFVGPELNRNEEWISTSSSFMTDIYRGGARLREYSHFMRPLAARFLVPEIRRVWRHQATARRLLVPVMNERWRRQRSTAEYTRPNDMIQWLMDNNAREKKPRSFGQLAELHLLVCFAALHTSTLAITHMIFDLAARPEYVAPLRDEAALALKQYGSWSSKPALSSLFKLDSFMKESQRLNPPSLLTYGRQAMRDVCLKGGVVLPKGSYLIIPAGMASLDGEYWEAPEEFRGFRFAELRMASKENRDKYQFATVSTRTMNFGYGREACPGRFFASFEIKSIMLQLLATFDLKLVDETAGRPKNRTSGAAIAPDETAQILFRKRKPGNDLDGR